MATAAGAATIGTKMIVRNAERPFIGRFKRTARISAKMMETGTSSKTN